MRICLYLHVYINTQSPHFGHFRPKFGNFSLKDPKCGFHFNEKYLELRIPPPTPPFLERERERETANMKKIHDFSEARQTTPSPMVVVVGIPSPIEMISPPTDNM